MAGEYVWAVDTPTGVMKNSALSRDVRAAAIANTTFMPFVRVEPGYGRKMGESVTIQRIRNISEPTTGTFDERDAVPIDTFSMSSTSITVSYWGRGVQFTEFAELLSTFDLTDSIQRKLRDQMALVLDSGAATAFKTGNPLYYIPTSVSAGTGPTGTLATTALENLSVQHVKVIRDAMMDTYHIPYYNGQNNYICLASTRALRGIKNDPEFLEWNKYRNADRAFYRGEVGMIENVLFIECNHTNALSNAKGSGSVLGEAVFFGDDAVAMAVVADPELRIAVPQNFGISRAVAWVGVLAFAPVWNTTNDGEARRVYVTSQ